MPVKSAARALFALAITGIACVQAEPLCFEGDADNIAKRNAWTHHSYILEVEAPRTTPGGTLRYASFTGVGYDDAVTPNGGTDIVHITGGAVQDVDGTWTVTILGTLHQQSITHLIGVPAYYVITENWVLNEDAMAGTAMVGNLTKNFMHRLVAGANDDYYPASVWSVPCESLR